MTSILTQSEFALSDAADDADRREALESIHGKAESMAGLIRRLLLLARMDAGQLRLERETVDLQMLAELAVASFEDAAAAKQMTLETAGGLPVEVSGDHAMLLQVVMNLVENAVRYGCEGGTVRLRAGRDGAQAWLSVEDDGPASRPRIWSASSSASIRPTRRATLARGWDFRWRRALPSSTAGAWTCAARREREAVLP